jgi:tetratricopeptide (TPR) repeat protein
LTLAHLQWIFFGEWYKNAAMSEKSLNEVARDIRLLFQKGNDALQRENYDYAIDLYNQVLAKEPTFFDCRKALRSAQFKKAGGGGGFFKKVLHSASSSPMVAKGQMALRKDPLEALQIAEQILNHDPYSSGAHRIVVEASLALEMPRTASVSLDVLVRNSPKDKALAIEFANALAEIGERARGEKVLSELSRVFPADNEIAQALKDLSARNTLNQGGYDAIASGQGSYRDILKDQKEAVSLEQEQRVQKSEDKAEQLMADYEVRLKTEPDNLKVIRNLAELYTQKKQFDRALEYYQRIQNSETGASDPTLQRAISETTVRQLDDQIEKLDPSSPDHAQNLARLNAEKLAFQISDCQKRVEKFPTDLAIRYEMGVLYFQTGKIGEAIQEFQTAQKNPHKRIAALNYLGQCYAKRKMFDLAARALQSAVKEKPIFDDEKKDLIYNLGSVFESWGKKDEAIEQFKQIYEVDIGYRDVGAKVDAFYAGQ